MSLRLDFAVRLATFSLRVDTTIDDGSTVAIIGANGAGKTTLISIICGIVNPGGGRVFVGDKDIIKDYRAARGQIGLGAASATVMLATVAAIVVPYLYSELRSRR